MRTTAPGVRARAARGGFTIVEVLLVTMIMGLMFVSISQLMQMARRTRDQVHNFQETQLAGPAILEMIATDLNGIFTYGRPRSTWLEVADRTVNGLDADRIDFVTTTDSLAVLPTFDADEEPLVADFNEVGYMLRESIENDEFLEIYRREDL
ncbi:MAG: type II secretion system protein, partial [Planctomycetota bacterium]